jgi:hypothetical protein
MFQVGEGEDKEEEGDDIDILLFPLVLLVLLATISCIGTVAKNVPNARKDSPPNTSRTPSIIARTAIIVTPIGLSF